MVEEEDWTRRPRVSASFLSWLSLRSRYIVVDKGGGGGSGPIVVVAAK